MSENEFWVVCPFCKGTGKEVTPGLCQCQRCEKRFTRKYAELHEEKEEKRRTREWVQDFGVPAWDGLRGCINCGNDTTGNYCSACAHQNMIDNSDY